MNALQTKYALARAAYETAIETSFHLQNAVVARWQAGEISEEQADAECEAIEAKYQSDALRSALHDAEDAMCKEIHAKVMASRITKIQGLKRAFIMMGVTVDRLLQEHATRAKFVDICFRFDGRC